MDNTQNLVEHQSGEALPIGTLKQRYNAALVILAGVLIGATVWLSLRPTEWAFLIFPILGAVGAVLLWLAIARFFFCRDARRLLAPSFKTPVKLALAVPAWSVCTLVLLAVPSDTAGWDEDLAGAVALGVTLLVIPLFLGGAIVLGAMAIYKGYKHKITTPATETPMYRNMPFGMAVLLFFFTIGAPLVLLLIFV